VSHCPHDALRPGTSVGGGTVVVLGRRGSVDPVAGASATTTSSGGTVIHFYVYPTGTSARSSAAGTSVLPGDGEVAVFQYVFHITAATASTVITILFYMCTIRAASGSADVCTDVLVGGSEGRVFAVISAAISSVLVRTADGIASGRPSTIASSSSTIVHVLCGASECERRQGQQSAAGGGLAVVRAAGGTAGRTGVVDVIHLLGGQEVVVQVSAAGRGGGAGAVLAVCAVQRGQSDRPPAGRLVVVLGGGVHRRTTVSIDNATGATVAVLGGRVQMQSAHTSASASGGMEKG
jgi:hypothetical protein